MTLLRNRATRLMIVVFLGVLLFAYSINALRISSQPIRPTPTAESQTYLFPDVLPPVITRIEVNNTRAGKQVTLTKKPGDWVGVDENGQAVVVELAQLPPMLQVLATLRYTDMLEISEADLATFGLSDGGWFIVNFEAASQTHTLRIGDVNASGLLSYVQIESDPKVYLVASVAVAQLVNIVDVPLATPTP